MNTHAQQSGTVVGGRIPFETCGAETLVCRRVNTRDVLPGATPLRLEDELCPLSTRSLSLAPTKTRSCLLICTSCFTAFQAEAYTDRGWFWSKVLVN